MRFWVREHKWTVEEIDIRMNAIDGDSYRKIPSSLLRADKITPEFVPLGPYLK